MSSHVAPDASVWRRRLLLVLILAGAFSITGVVWRVIRAPNDDQGSPLLVNDVTQLHPILVDRVIAAMP